jgi:hypothetical protein
MAAQVYKDGPTQALLDDRRHTRASGSHKWTSVVCDAHSANSNTNTCCTCGPSLLYSLTVSKNRPSTLQTRRCSELQRLLRVAGHVRRSRLGHDTCASDNLVRLAQPGQQQHPHLHPHPHSVFLQHSVPRCPLSCALLRVLSSKVTRPTRHRLVCAPLR